MTARRSLSLLLALALLLVPATSLGASADHHPHPRGSSTVPGIDGQTYDASPLVVPGLDQEKFFGPDFDLACGYGKRISAGMRELAKLARIIAQSGRTVVFTVAPNKSSVLTSSVDRTQLPHGSCDRVGLKQQQQVLDRFSDPHYLPLRRLLGNDRRQTYWKTDLHWTSVGGAVFSKALASKLDPRLGRRQNYHIGSLTALGGLNSIMHDAEEETAPDAKTRNGVKVWPRKIPVVNMFDNDWVAKPYQRTWPGRTLIIGDSMMFMALYTLRPLFARGRAMWVGHVDTADLAKAIARSDTVVLESIQIFVPVTDLVSKKFRSQVKRALRARAGQGR